MYAFVAMVPLLGNKLAMPAKDGIRREQAADVAEQLAAETDRTRYYPSGAPTPSFRGFMFGAMVVGLVSTFTGLFSGFIASVVVAGLRSNKH